MSEKIISKLRGGSSHLVDSSAELQIPINSNRWEVTTEFKDAVSDSDVVLITVPTPVNPDNSPDLSYVEAASESVISNISPGSKTAVVLQSTVYPGVTLSLIHI